MTITPAQLQTAAELLGSAPTLRDAAALWRGQHPGLRAMLVDAMDMRDETAALRVGARNVYLASTNGHCWSLTRNPELADALILTQDGDGRQP